MKFVGSSKIIFILLAIMALLVARSSGSGGYVARDIFPSVHVVFGGMSGAYAEAVRRSGVFDTFEPDEHFYTYLLPEDLGMSDKVFLARKDLLNVVKYHILVGPVSDEPLADGEDPYDRLHRGESIEVRTLLGPTVTLTPRGQQIIVNGTTELESDPDDFRHATGSGYIVGVETLIPFPEETDQ